MGGLRHFVIVSLLGKLWIHTGEEERNNFDLVIRVRTQILEAISWIILHVYSSSEGPLPSLGGYKNLVVTELT